MTIKKDRLRVWESLCRMHGRATPCIGKHGAKALRVRFGVAVLVGLAAASACHGREGATCEVMGRRFGAQQQITCADGCNACLCANGEVLATLLVCDDDAGSAAGKFQCKEGGTWRAHGEAWTCKDGCSHCTCNDGKVSTEPRGCVPLPKIIPLRGRVF